MRIYQPMIKGPFSRGVVVLACAILLSLAHQAHAQMAPAQADIKTMTGRVEILRRGQAQWTAATAGAKLGQGDEIRTASGASAELELPDTTNILVAENTRFAVTKLVM